MKTMFGCGLASVMGLMLILGLCSRGAIYVDPGYWKTNPRLDLPTISYWTSCHRHHEIHVSLNRHHQWIFEDGETAGEDLKSGLARRVIVWETLGYKPSIRVRIAAHEPARHFLQFHQAATSVGIEEFSIACFRARAR